MHRRTTGLWFMLVKTKQKGFQKTDVNLSHRKIIRQQVDEFLVTNWSFCKDWESCRVSICRTWFPNDDDEAQNIII